MTSERLTADDSWGSDLDVAEWFVWFARKYRGKARDVAQQALDQHPGLRFSERANHALMQAATLDAVPLDVERLARAFHILHSPFDEAQCVERDVEDARLMAREYARLASSEPREDADPRDHLISDERDAYNRGYLAGVENEAKRHASPEPREDELRANADPRAIKNHDDSCGWAYGNLGYKCYCTPNPAAQQADS